jgi:hypothetical protein
MGHRAHLKCPGDVIHMLPEGRHEWKPRPKGDIIKHGALTGTPRPRARRRPTNSLRVRHRFDRSDGELWMPIRQEYVAESRELKR